MGKKEKLLARLESNPKDFTFDEMKLALEFLGFIMEEGSGSRVRFNCNSVVIRMHKPHPQKELQEYQVKQAVRKLKEEGFL